MEEAEQIRFVEDRIDEMLRALEFDLGRPITHIDFDTRNFTTRRVSIITSESD